MAREDGEQVTVETEMQHPSVELLIKRRRQALRWSPTLHKNVDKVHKGRPENTWKKSLEKEMRTAGINWTGMDRRAQERAGWRAVFVGGYT